MATNVKYYAMGFLQDGTPSVRTFAKTKAIEKQDEEYISNLKVKVLEMADDVELATVEIITAEDYNLYVNGDGKEEYSYIRDMETGKPKKYIPPEPTKEEQQISNINSITANSNIEVSKLKDAMILALLSNDTERQEELRQEYSTLQQNTSTQIQEVMVNAN